jgi:hypothetical protein
LVLPPAFILLRKGKNRLPRSGSSFIFPNVNRRQRTLKIGDAIMV